MTPDELFTPGYKAWCERRWIEVQQRGDVNAEMERRITAWLEQPNRIVRYVPHGIIIRKYDCHGKRVA